MIDPLPNWYPLANASDEDIDAWLDAETPPYQEMRKALPWLDQAYQFDAWIEGVRDARARSEGGAWMAKAFPAIASIPLPPRRVAGRAAR